MMSEYMEKITPEEAGISSGDVMNFLKALNGYRVNMHSVLLAKGDRIFAEVYWNPFHEQYLHRIYSDTKSYVGTAVAQLASEGKISLEDPIIQYFPDKLPEVVHPWLQALTIRNMLDMQTCMQPPKWITAQPEDRVSYYFHCKPVRYPGTTWAYDSNGSFILGSLVRRVTGKDFLEYLRELCLDEIGYSKEAYCLYTPGGELWSDSGLICTMRDNFKFIRLLARGGSYNGKQLLDPETVRQAVERPVDNSSFNYYSWRDAGYGNQIWHYPNGCFGFSGMHGQMAVHHPETDITLVCNSGYKEPCGAVLFDAFFDHIIDKAGKESLPNDEQLQDQLNAYIEDCKLVTAYGSPSSTLEEEINGRKFVVEEENPMGITEFTLRFDEPGGSFCYVNEQGEKELRFGRKENVFQKFPQTGYSKEVGSVPCEGHQYGCAVSAAWKEEKKFFMLVQILDEYFGVLGITFGFRDNRAVIRMEKEAECFLDEYSGYATGVLETAVQ